MDASNGLGRRHLSWDEDDRIANHAGYLDRELFPGLEQDQGPEAYHEYGHGREYRTAHYEGYQERPDPGAPHLQAYQETSHEDRTW